VNRRLVLILLGLTLLAFALRVYRLHSQSLWYDEGFSVHLAGQGLTAITTGELNPPLYHYLLHFWLPLAGRSEFAVRFLSVVFGALLVPLVARLGCHLFDAPTGFLAALFTAVAPFHLHYSQEARMYALVTFLVVLSSYLLLRALQNPGSRWLWLGYGLASLAALYTHYYAFLVLAAQFVYCVLRAAYCVLRDRKHAVRNTQYTTHSASHVSRFTLCFLLLSLAYLPWLPYLLDHYRQQTASYWPSVLSLSFLIQRTLEAFTTGSYLEGPVVGYVALGYGLLMGLGVVLGLWGDLRKPPSPLPGLGRERGGGARGRAISGTLFLALSLVVPFVLVYLLVHDRPKFSPRYLLVIWPAFTLLVARGVRALLPDVMPVRSLKAVKAWPVVLRASWVALALLLVLGTAVYANERLYFDQTYGRDDFRGVAAYLTEHAGPDDVILLESGHVYPVFTYYYPRGNWYPVPSRLTPSPSVEDILTYDVARELNPVLAGRDEVWVLLWQHEVVDPNGVLLTLLDWAFEPRPVKGSFHGLELRRYRVPPGGQLPESITFTQSVESEIAGDLVLRGYAMASPSTPSGGTLEVLLGWKALRPMETIYKLSLRLRDSQGLEWAKYDARLAGFWYPTDRWKPGEEVYGRHRLSIPPGTPPGPYRLDMVIYRHPDQSHVKTISLGEVVVSEPDHFPTASELHPSRSLWADWEGLRLLGYELEPRKVSPGDQVILTLYWETSGKPALDYLLWTDLGRAQTRPLAEAYPTSRWPVGAVLVTRHRLIVPPRAEPGDLELRVALADQAGRPLDPSVALTSVRVLPQTRIFEVPGSIQHPRQVAFGGIIQLLGYDLEMDQGPGARDQGLRTEVRPASILRLTLYWQALAESETSHSVFTHLLDADSQIWAQHDGVPAGGTRPTTGWLPGEVIVDRHDLRVPPGALPGTYILEIGLYDPLTGERLPAIEPDGRRLPDDRVILQALSLEEP